MEIIVDYISNGLVYYTSIFGKSSALWHGTAPKENCGYIVEFEIVESFHANLNLWKVCNNTYEINKSNNGTIFIGKLESVDDDGYAVLRMGDSIISFDIIDNITPVGSFIRIIASEVCLYPIDY